MYIPTKLDKDTELAVTINRVVVKKKDVLKSGTVSSR